MIVDEVEINKKNITVCIEEWPTEDNRLVLSWNCAFTRVNIDIHDILQESVWHRHICAAVFPSVLHHSHLLPLHLLQASKQQKETVEEQEFEEEKLVREGFEEKNDDKPDAGLDGDDFRMLLGECRKCSWSENDYFNKIILTAAS